jgi:hypothetical protein
MEKVLISSAKAYPKVYKTTPSVAPMLVMTKGGRRDHLISPVFYFVI